jgi:hypothetical protein
MAKPSTAQKLQKYRSGFEEKVQKFLTAKGIKHSYESETLKYVVPEKTRRYVADFSLTGTNIIIEAKGIFDSDDRQKMMLLREQYPDRDIRMLFMRDNGIIRRSKTKYTDWCAKNGIKAAVDKDGKLPKEWLDDLAALGLIAPSKQKGKNQDD